MVGGMLCKSDKPSIIIIMKCAVAAYAHTYPLSKSTTPKGLQKDADYLTKILGP